ncbi:MAG TPA: hypothetical protein VMV28_06010 [Thermoplasmata archaeon]|nr:hypothetical protein [Thermoplasmata archaeon]
MPPVHPRNRGASGSQAGFTYPTGSLLRSPLGRVRAWPTAGRSSSARLDSYGALGISYLGDQFLICDNFLTPPSCPITIGLMGIINTPYDLVVPIVFGVAMFAWGCFTRIRPRPAPIGAAPPDPSTLPGTPGA